MLSHRMAIAIQASTTPENGAVSHHAQHHSVQPPVRHRAVRAEAELLPVIWLGHSRGRPESIARTAKVRINIRFERAARRSRKPKLPNNVRPRTIVYGGRVTRINQRERRRRQREGHPTGAECRRAELRRRKRRRKWR